MSRSRGLLRLLRPYSFLFSANIVATLLASVMDGATFVMLIPFLRSLFGERALQGAPDSTVERILNAVVGPVLASGGSPQGALRNVVIVLVIALVLKNALSYGASVASVAIQEG